MAELGSAVMPQRYFLWKLIPFRLVRSRCPITGVHSQHLLLAHVVVELLDVGLCWENSRIPGGYCPGVPCGRGGHWVFYINPSQCLVWQHTHTFYFMADFYFSIKSRHKWRICWGCSSEEQLCATHGLLILSLWWVWSPWPGTTLTQVKAHQGLRPLLGISAPIASLVQE